MPGITLHLRGGKLFQTRHQRERDGHASLLSDPKHQPRLPSGQALARRRPGLGGVLFPQLADHAGHLRQAQHVEDEGHTSVAHNGGAGEAGHRLQLLGKRFDHDLFSVINLVDHQPELAVARLQHHDVHRFRSRSVAQAQFAVEVNQGQQIAAQTIDRSSMKVLDAALGVNCLAAHQFDQADLGDGETFASTGNDECRNDGQGQGNFDL